MFEKIPIQTEEEEASITYVKNENGQIVQREEAKSVHDEDTAEPVFGSEKAVPEEEVDKRFQRFLSMSEEEKDQLTCDDAFVLYLGDVAKYVNPTYYKTVLRFVLLYRECLNELGW